MKAIILAAGTGSRLKPHTDTKPKCLLEIAEQTLLARQINQLRNFGISQIAVVRGYLGHQINYPDVRYYDNQDFASTNMVHSLFQAVRELSGETLICYGDLMLHQRVIQTVLSSPEDITVCIDRDWQKLWQERFGRADQDLESLTLNETGDQITSLGQTVSDTEKIDGRYVGLIKLSGHGCHTIKNTFAYSKKRYGHKTWPTSGKPFRQGYMTDLLQEIISLGFPVHAATINNGWLELDQASDYEQAERLFSKFIINHAY